MTIAEIGGRWRAFLSCRVLDRLASGFFAFLLLAAPASAAAAGGVPQGAGFFEIIGHADWVVKGVMLILLIASIATWALLIAKLSELRSAKKALVGDIALLESAPSLLQAGSYRYRATDEMLAVASNELAAAGSSPTRRAIKGVEERFAVKLPIIESRATHRVLRGSNVIASIGATAPFIGLAGTVWGIMNSFLGIAATKSTSLAVVAPGIAEALLATALGLAVAIPAVLIYNTLARATAGYRRLLNEAAVLVACVLSRELEGLDSETSQSVGTSASNGVGPVSTKSSYTGAQQSLVRGGQ